MAGQCFDAVGLIGDGCKVLLDFAGAFGDALQGGIHASQLLFQATDRAEG